MKAGWLTFTATADARTSASGNGRLRDVSLKPRWPYSRKHLQNSAPRCSSTSRLPAVGMAI